MSNQTTRRNILTAAAALPILPTAALAALPVEAATADAELLRLGVDLDHAWARELALICDDGDCRGGYSR